MAVRALWRNVCAHLALPTCTAAFSSSPTLPTPAYPHDYFHTTCGQHTRRSLGSLSCSTNTFPGSMVKELSSKALLSTRVFTYTAR